MQSYIYDMTVIYFQGLEVIGNPVMNCFAIKSTDEKNLRILVLADEMEKKGFWLSCEGLQELMSNAIAIMILPHITNTINAPINHHHLGI